MNKDSKLERVSKVFNEITYKADLKQYILSILKSNKGMAKMAKKNPNILVDYIKKYRPWSPCKSPVRSPDRQVSTPMNLKSP